jgi:hypothetical protein
MASRLRKAAKVVGLAAVGVAGGVATFTLIYTNSKSQVMPPPAPLNHSLPPPTARRN